MNREKFRGVTKNKENLNQFLRLYGLEVVRQTAKEYGAVVGLSLRDELGFGKKRTERFLEGVMRRFMDVRNGLLSVEDIVETLENEIKLKIE